MPDPATISFVGTKELKDLLKQWADQDDRSVSYIIRQILEREAQRRAANDQPPAETVKNINRIGVAG